MEPRITLELTAREAGLLLVGIRLLANLSRPQHVMTQEEHKTWCDLLDKFGVAFNTPAQRVHFELALTRIIPECI